MELVDRSDVIEKAIIDCLDEMYRRSQPSITWEEIQKQAKEDPKRHIWREHYLPQWLYQNIQNKYVRMYRLQEEWSTSVGLVERYLLEGGTKDKYIEAHTDEHGNYHPGYRGYEDVKPLKDQINDFFKSHNICPGEREVIVSDIIKMVMGGITDCKNFYHHDRDYLQFSFNVSNYSPNSNIEAVREFYKDTDIVINEIEMDEDYDD